LGLVRGCSLKEDGENLLLQGVGLSAEIAVALLLVAAAQFLKSVRNKLINHSNIFAIQ
jgi:hypothetical protein